VFDPLLSFRNVLERFLVKALISALIGELSRTISQYILLVLSITLFLLDCAVVLYLNFSTGYRPLNLCRAVHVDNCALQYLCKVIIVSS